MNKELFLTRVSDTANKFKALSPSRVIIFHHNDSDGVTSGAILIKTMERLSQKFSAYSLEKPYYKALEWVFNDQDLEDDTVFIFADFASGMLSEISRINRGRFEVFVLDHHTIDSVEDKKITLLNPIESGFSGSFDCSASSVCYFFSQAISEFNCDLAKIAVAGALGDRMLDKDSKLTSLNEEVFKIA